MVEKDKQSQRQRQRVVGMDLRVLVLESQQAGRIRDSYCQTDKTAAVKLARVYLSGMAKAVWQPDPKTRLRREVLHRHRQAVNNSTRGKNRIKTFLNEHCIRLPKGFRLTSNRALESILKMRSWEQLQEQLLQMMFAEMRLAEHNRKQLRAIMAREVLQGVQLLQLVRLMGIRHIAAYSIGAVIGQVERFATAKKLVAYLGLAPRTMRSGICIKKRSCLVSFGRKDLRATLTQVAQNALNRASHPLHKWGWRLFARKGHRNIAVSAVARKIAVAIWHMLMGHMTPLAEKENLPSIRERISKLITAVGFKEFKAQGYPTKSVLIEEKMSLIFESA